jgi:hypothetical protein
MIGAADRQLLSFQKPDEQAFFRYFFIALVLNMPLSLKQVKPNPNKKQKLKRLKGICESVMRIGIIRSRETRLVSSAILHIRALSEMSAAACLVPHSVNDLIRLDTDDNF